MFVPASENKQLRLYVCTSFMALRGWCVCGRPKRALRLARAGGRYLYARALVHPEWGRRLREGTAPPLDARGACCGAWRQHQLLLLWRKQLLLWQLVVRGILQVKAGT